MNNKEFSNYLATGEYTDAEDAALLVVESAANDSFFSILANLCAVEMLAKDFHYRAKGKSFYGEHLLADLIHDVGKSADDLNEIHYMGEMAAEPPFRAEVAKAAVAIIDGIPGWPVENDLIYGLNDCLQSLVNLVEEAKKDEPASGTTAVLDEISQKSLQAIGFLRRVMSGDEMTSKVDADAEAPIEANIA